MTVVTASAAARSTSTREARDAYYRRNHLPLDGGHAAASWRPLRWPGLALHLPNFAWRRAALPLHDLHHVLVDCPCTPTGEFQIAAWEFAAGRFPHPLATAFCLPLLGLGALAAPRHSFRAFVTGRSSRSLYRHGLTPQMLDAPLEDLRRTLLPAHRPAATVRDVFAYAGWVALALLWMALPAALLAAGVMVALR